MKIYNAKGLIILALFICLATTLPAQGNLGQSGANFLQIPADAKGAALGGAGVASITGAPGLFWNPSSIAQIEGIDLSVAYTNWFLDTRLTYAAAATSLGEASSLGLTLTSFSMDDTEITTEQNPGGTGELYSAGNLAVGLAYARQMTDRFSFGVTGKYIQENIWNSTASQVALDIGSRYRTDFKNLVLGMAVRNVGGTLLFSEDAEDVKSRLDEEAARDEDNNPRIERLSPGYRLPQVFHVGVTFDALQTHFMTWKMMIDADIPSDNTERIILASELGFSDRIFLRGAYRDGFDFSHLSFGAGLKFPLGGNSLRLDYAVVLSDHFGALQTVGISSNL